MNTTNTQAVELTAEQKTINKRQVKKSFNWAMLSIVAYAIIATILQMIGAGIFKNMIETTTYGQYLLILIPMHIIACPIALFIFSRRKFEKPEKNKLKFKQFVGFTLVMAFFAAVGLIISSVLSSVIDLSSASEQVASLTQGENWFMRVLTVGIAAPIGEELIFRKLVVDATHKYSEKFAVFFSGLLFGLFHGNFVQFFFTFLIGMLFAYVYTRTGNILYSIALHMTMNLTTSVITAAVSGSGNEILSGAWILFLCLVAIVGGVIFFIKIRKIKFVKHPEYEVPKKAIWTSAFLNIFTILFLAFTIFLFVSSLLQ